MRNFYEQLFLKSTSGGCFWKVWVYNIHARFTQGVLQLLFTFFDWKISTAIFYFLLRKVFETYQVYYTILLMFWIFFISTFSVLLNDYFFRWLAYKSLLCRFSLLINYIMWSYNIFSVSCCFPWFSWSWLFRVRVQDLGPGLRSCPTLVHIFSYIEEEKMWK